MSASQLEITYPPELPVSQRREDIAAAIRDHQVVVLAGETGSGKTTQLPKICLELGRGKDKMIGHTQPRRIAARSVAERIADELGTELGDLVGYQVRFTDRTSKRSRVKLMTDGILLAELQRDRQLRRYDTIIIDEAHERSLNIDFLLGYLKRLLPRRPDLKLIITSATIDVERFAEHFDAPVVEVSGRTYPVEVRYRPLVELPEADDEGEPIVRDQTEAILDAVRELFAEGPGDILVFLPGEREIRDTADALAEVADAADRGRAALLAALGGRAAPGVRRAHRAPRRARHQRRRDVADRARGSGTSSTPASRGSAATRCAPRCSGCRSRRSARPRPTSAPAAAAGSGRASRSGSTPRRTSRAARSSPTPRSCGPTWPASSCRWPRSGWATWRGSRSSSRRTGATSRAGVQLLEELGALRRATG